MTTTMTTTKTTTKTMMTMSRAVLHVHDIALADAEATADLLRQILNRPQKRFEHSTKT